MAGTSKRCGKCKNTIESKELFVDCGGVCKKFFHAACAGIDNNQYETIKQSESICYRCVNCNTYDNGMMEMMKAIKLSMTKIEVYQKKHHVEMTERIEKVEKTLEVSGKTVIEEIKKVDEEIKKVDLTLNNDGAWTVVEKKNKKKPQSNFRKATVIVTPIHNNKPRDELRKSLKNNIESSANDIMRLANAPANGISIVCEDEEKCNKLIKEIESKFDDQVTVTKPKNFNPRIKLLKLHDADKDDNRFVEILKNKNPQLEMAELKIIKRENVRINGKIIENLTNVIIEVNPTIHNEIMKTRKIKHVWETVRVVDNVYVRRCYNCMGFNHNAIDCKNMKACGQCSGEHSSRECCVKEKTCVNCKKANHRMNQFGNTKITLDVNHSAWSNDCNVYKRKVEYSKKAINTID